MSRQIDLTEEFVELGRPEQILRFNPLAQIPVLVLPDGSALYDSQTIMLHLDDCHGGPRLFPPGRRSETLTTASLCDGLMEATLQRLLETRKPAQQQSPDFITKLEQRIQRGVLALEQRPLTASADEFIASDMAAIAALGYCDFRYKQEWRVESPGLAAWFAAAGEHAMVRNTAPTRTTPAISR